jgi:crossover junction endodeoxyribonuclease RuvC
MRIIGIDPGMAIVGYCILDYTCNNPENPYQIINTGSIRTSKTRKTSERLLEIHNDIKELVKTYNPDAASLEQLFYFKNAKTIISVSEARGVILMTFEMLNIPVYEYTPLVVKQTLTGYGRSGKEDVREILKCVLFPQNIPKLDDTTDAIAIAICQTMAENN